MTNIKVEVNLKQFLKQFGDNALLALQSAEKALNSATKIVYKSIIERTPVGNPALWHPPYWPKGYKPGTLKKSWEMLPKQGFSLKKSDKNYIVTIQNEQPYANRVEYGWSTQAPYGMMRITVAEFKHIIEQQAQRFRK